MTASNFLEGLAILTVLLLVWQRALFSGEWSRLVRVLIFATALSYFFDYTANTREIWVFGGEWTPRLLGNPLETVVFADVMAVILLVLYLRSRGGLHSQE